MCHCAARLFRRPRHRIRYCGSDFGLTERRYRDSGVLEIKADADTEAVDVHGAQAIAHRADNENLIWLMVGIAVLD